MLVVDDDPAMANSMVRPLKQGGWVTQVALDGFEAGQALGQFRPGLMILDLKMPYMNGFKVLQLARKKFNLQQLRILVASVQGEDDLNKALKKGADGVLEKPFIKEHFPDVINQWLGTPLRGGCEY